MYAKNLLITFLGFLIALTAYFNSQSGIKEPFLGLHVRGVSTPQQVISNRRGSFSTKTASAACHKQPFINQPKQNMRPNNMRARENYHAQRRQTRQGPPTFVVPGHYQSNLSPRMQPQPYSANISYNAPSQQYLGVPKTPLGYATDVQRHNIRENFKGNNDLSASLRLDKSAAALPAVAMDQGARQQQNFTVDRFYTAIAKPPGLRGSDYIRGDLAVVPQAAPCRGQAWGIPAAAYPSYAHTQLNKGALSVMAGPNNEQGQSINRLVQKLSGGVDTFSGGVDNPVLSDTTVGAAMGSQVHMRAGRRGPQNVVSATAF